MGLRKLTAQEQATILTRMNNGHSRTCDVCCGVIEFYEVRLNAQTETVEAHASCKCPRRRHIETLGTFRDVGLVAT